MKVPHFQEIPSPEPPRFTDRPPPEKRMGPGDFAATESKAEKAKAAQEALVKELQSKQITVPGAFRPSDFPDLRQPDCLETVELSGGQADGRVVNIQRGAKHHTVTCANPDQTGNPYIPVEYVRAKKINSRGLAIFDCQPSAPVAV